MTTDNVRSWALQEAEKIFKARRDKIESNQLLIFETGYGPSGLPHIGTFGENLRTTAVMQELANMAPDARLKLIVFSDDLDPLRKVPDNVPNRDMLFPFIGVPVSKIPSPFGDSGSYGNYMNSKLRSFLDSFGFEYEFKSSCECYESGFFDKVIKDIMFNFEAIKNVVIPILGEDRRETYSPLMPICEETGKLLQVVTVSVDPVEGTFEYKREDGKICKASALGGHSKMQWRADWGMRWAAIGVDYEMYGKDLQPSATISEKICKILKKPPPQLFRYELFLDGEGKKISKSKGNGISMDEWLEVAPEESLRQYLKLDPKRARRLHFSVIPKAVDDCVTDKNLDVAVNFSMLLNLASACNPEKESVLWGFVQSYDPSIYPGKNAFYDEMIKKAVFYYEKYVKPEKRFLEPNAEERKILNDLLLSIKEAGEIKVDSRAIQSVFLEVGKRHGYENKMREWFLLIYRFLFGSESGPKMGNFVRIFGFSDFISFFEKRLNGL